MMMMMMMMMMMYWCPHLADRTEKDISITLIFPTTKWLQYRRLVGKSAKIFCILCNIENDKYLFKKWWDQTKMCCQRRLVVSPLRFVAQVTWPNMMKDMRLRLLPSHDVIVTSSDNRKRREGQRAFTGTSATLLTLESISMGGKYLQFQSSDEAKVINPLIATLKPQSNGPPYSNTMIGALTVDGWAVTFGTARRGLGGPAAPPRCTKCNSPPINGQCVGV